MTMSEADRLGELPQDPPIIQDLNYDDRTLTGRLNKAVDDGEFDCGRPVCHQSSKADIEAALTAAFCHKV